MIQIVIADDHRIFLDGLTSLINRKTDIHCVGIATDAYELLKLVDRNPVDIAVLDISMPGMNGIELSKVLKEKYPKIKTLLLSSFHEREKIQAGLEAGISGYILKEKGQEELEKAILHIHNGGQYYTEAVMQTVIDIARTGNNEVQKKSKLTDRELDVLSGIMEGLTTPEIASKLFISESTVSTHRKNIHSKLGVSKMNQLIKLVNEQNILGE